MVQYAILRNPAHNAVYFQAAEGLARHELSLSKLSVEQIEIITICNISYLGFQTANPLEQQQLQVIARLSSTYALFERQNDALIPVALPDPCVYDRSLGTILKYKGKTNEIFTRMLVNLALFTANIPPQSAKLYDPVAGRGTTLFEGLTLGMEVYGTEVYDKNVTEGYTYFKKFLEKGRIKHKTKVIRTSGENRSYTAKRHMVDTEQSHFELVEGDCRFADKLFSKGFFDCIVGDLPYGVQHASKTGGLSRSPAYLIEEAGQAWHTVLKKSGVLVLAFNSLVVSRKKLAEILEKQGFCVLEQDGYQKLEHQVDASILRDVIVATKN